MTGDWFTYPRRGKDAPTQRLAEAIYHQHRVPLSRRAGQILDARTLGDGNPLVFPSGCGKRLNDMALSGLLEDLEIAAVPHGFRSLPERHSPACAGPRGTGFRTANRAEPAPRPAAVRAASRDRG